MSPRIKRPVIKTLGTGSSAPELLGSASVLEYSMASGGKGAMVKLTPSAILNYLTIMKE